MADKFAGGIKAGSVDVSIPVVLRTAADNLETTGVAHGDVTASYWRQGGSRTAITMAALTNLTDAHADGGWKEVDATNMPGAYRFDLPDAAVATGAEWVVIAIKVASSYVFYERFALTTNVVQTGDSFARLGAPAGASVSADVAALPTANGNADALLDRANGIAPNVTPRQAISRTAALVGGIVSGAGTGTETFKAMGAAADGTTVAVVSADDDGNRTAISYP